MKNITLTEDQLGLIKEDDNLKKFVISQYIGSDDILTVSGYDIKEMFLEDKPNDIQNVNLLLLLDWYLNDISGNSFDIITISDGELVKVEIEEVK